MTQQLSQDTGEGPTPNEPRSFLDRYFAITRRGSTYSRELRGGLTTFVAMSYIILLNPLILGSTADITGATLGTAELTTATALSAGLTTILMGLVGNAPLSMAAGLGVIPVVAFTIAPEMTWAQAFGLVVLEGVCIVLMAISGVRERIINAIPLPLKTALTVGIGLYIALVGLVRAGFVTRRPDSADSTVPVPEKISNFEQLLNSKNFIRVHKSFIVSKSKIKSIEGNRILILDNYIPIGQTYKLNLKKILNY